MEEYISAAVIAVPTACVLMLLLYLLAKWVDTEEEIKIDQGIERSRLSFARFITPSICLVLMFEVWGVTQIFEVYFGTPGSTSLFPGVTLKSTISLYVSAFALTVFIGSMIFRTLLIVVAFGITAFVVIQTGEVMQTWYRGA